MLEVRRIRITVCDCTDSEVEYAMQRRMNVVGLTRKLYESGVDSKLSILRVPFDKRVGANR
jgi:hypothetical protein